MVTLVKGTIADARARAAAVGVSNLLTIGTVAGVFAGFIFILANMWYAPTQHLPAVAPFYAIGTIFYHDAAPQMTPAYAIVGLITHFSLSIAFGLTFALFVVPFARNIRGLIIGGVLFGVLLYVVDYQILGRLVFKAFDPSNPMAPDPTFGAFTHIVIYPLGLIPFFLTVVRRHGSAPAAPTTPAATAGAEQPDRETSLASGGSGTASDGVRS